MRVQRPGAGDRRAWASRRAAPTSTAPSASASGSTSPAWRRGRRSCAAQANPLLCVLESDAANNTTSAVAGDPGRAGGGRRRARPVGWCSPVRSWRPTCPRAAAAAAQPGRTTARLLRLGLGGGAAALQRSCASRRTGWSRWRRAPTGCARARPTRRRRASRARTRFTYVATDARGLTSPPATARVTVPAAPAAAPVVAPARGAALAGAGGQAAGPLARRAAGERAGAAVGAARAAARRAEGHVPAALAARVRAGTGADGARPPGARALPAAAVRRTASRRRRARFRVRRF